MKSLCLNQMEKVQGGLTSSCWWSIAGWGALAVGAAFLTGGASLIAWGIGAAATTGSTLTSCK